MGRLGLRVSWSTTYLDTQPELLTNLGALRVLLKVGLARLSAKLGSRLETLCVDHEDTMIVTTMVPPTTVVINCAGLYFVNNGAILLGTCAREGLLLLRSCQLCIQASRNGWPFMISHSSQGQK